MDQGRKIQELENLRKELESMIQNLRQVHNPASRALLIEEFKKNLITLRRGVLEL